MCVEAWFCQIRSHISINTLVGGKHLIRPVPSVFTLEPWVCVITQIFGSRIGLPDRYTILRGDTHSPHYQPIQVFGSRIGLEDTDTQI